MRRRLHRKGGSVLVYVLVITIAMCSIVLTIVALAGFHYTQTLSGERAERAKYALEGSLNKARYDLSQATIAVPASPNYTIGAWNVAASVTDNSATLANTLQVNLSASRWGRTFTHSFVIGNCSPPDKTWWNYVVAMNLPSVFGGYMTTHGANDSVFSNNTFTLASNSTITKDLYTVGPTKPVKMTVLGTFYGSYGSKIWFTPKASDYAGVANITLSGAQYYTSGAYFPSPYYVAYVNGDLHIGGTFSGTCTAFVTGNVYIDAPVNYATIATDKLVIVTPGTIHLNSAGGHFSGYYFAGTGVAIDQSMTMDSGGIVAAAITGSPLKNLDVTWDNSVQQNPGLGANLHMPGFWP